MKSMTPKTAKPDLVPALNSKGHKVYVTKETMKKKPGEFKPVPRDESHPAHKSEHHESAPQSVKDNYHGAKVSKEEAKKGQAEAKKAVESPKVQSALGKMMDHKLFTKDSISPASLRDLSEGDMEELAGWLEGRGSVGEVLLESIPGMAFVGMFGGAMAAVGASGGLLAGVAIMGGLMSVVSGWNAMDDHAERKIERMKEKKGAAGIKAAIERTLHSPTMKDLEIGSTITNGKGHLDPEKFVVRLKSAQAPLADGGKEAGLRSRTIRLAYENPELRAHLLPLLKENP